jgi:hypothetical protein
MSASTASEISKLKVVGGALAAVQAAGRDYIDNDGTCLSASAYRARFSENDVQAMYLNIPNPTGLVDAISPARCDIAQIDGDSKC